MQQNIILNQLIKQFEGKEFTIKYRDCDVNKIEPLFEVCQICDVLDLQRDNHTVKKIAKEYKILGVENHQKGKVQQKDKKSFIIFKSKCDKAKRFTKFIVNLLDDIDQNKLRLIDQKDQIIESLDEYIEQNCCHQVNDEDKLTYMLLFFDKQINQFRISTCQKYSLKRIKDKYKSQQLVIECQIPHGIKFKNRMQELYPNIKKSRITIENEQERHQFIGQYILELTNNKAQNIVQQQL